MSTFMHYSTEINGSLVIKNVYWKFELETYKRMVIFQQSIYYNYWSHCNWKFDTNFGTRNQKFFNISVIILEQMLRNPWPDLWAEWRIFNQENMSTFMHYSTDIIGLLLIKNVYWKFELETIKRWSFFSHQCNKIADLITIGSLILTFEW